MVEINLMPWRTQKIAYERKKMKWLISAGVVLAMILMTIIHILLSRQIQRDEKTLRQLEAALPPAVDAVHGNQKTVLDGSSEGFLTGKSVTELLKMIAQSSISGVCYQQLMRDESGWRLTGRALSVTAFAAAWRSLAAGILFKNSVINELKKDVASDYFQFSIHVPNVSSGREE